MRNSITIRKIHHTALSLEETTIDCRGNAPRFVRDPAKKC